jgi:3'(2'), 5'-bisphosphate nucleotidase
MSFHRLQAAGAHSELALSPNTDVFKVADFTTQPIEISARDISNLDAIADIFAEIAIEAAIPAMTVYASVDMNVHRKPDSSPVCDADEFVEALILKRLASRLPGFPVLSEEASARGERGMIDSTFILVDPIDGTREFLSRNGEFTINIALVVDGVPRVGVVYAPALGKLWIGGDRATLCTVSPGASLPPSGERRIIHVRKAPSQGLTAVASRSHSDAATEAFLAGLSIAERRPAGSSLKFCAVAEGSADVYPRFGTTMEWDTAAGDAVLRAAGGMVRNEDGTPLRYGKAEAQFKNGPFIAWGDAASGCNASSILR